MGNPNVVQLEMTKNAFKLASQIYHFLLDLEKHVTAFMKYEYEYVNVLATTKTMIAIEPDENTDDDSMDLSTFPCLPVDSYDNKNVVYLFYLRRYRA